MTTIVADRRRMIMVSDSRVTCGPYQFKTQKIFETSDGSLIGISGHLDDGKLLVEWLEAGMPDEKPAFSEGADFTALVFSKRGFEIWNEALKPALLDEDFYSVGSGCCFATGALLAGATAEEAIAIAAMRDPDTGLPVVVKSYKAKKSKRRPSDSKHDLFT